jgi:hypothetical protein
MPRNTKQTTAFVSFYDCEMCQISKPTWLSSDEIIEILDDPIDENVAFYDCELDSDDFSSDKQSVSSESEKSKVIR